MKPINISTVRRPALISITAAFALLAVGSGPSRSGVQQSDFIYTAIFADAQGVTHFRDERSAWNRPMADAKGIRFVRARAGRQGELINAPAKQWLILMSGVADIETSDGARRTFGPGSVLLVTDTQGRGHRELIGDQDVLAAIVRVPD